MMPIGGGAHHSKEGCFQEAQLPWAGCSPCNATLSSDASCRRVASRSCTRRAQAVWSYMR
eukprot:350905-Chlamydomonas_euryale.AAC.2